MASHDWLDSLRGFVSMVERDCADVVVKHVSLDNAMKELTANKSKFTINCRGSATNIVPRCTSVVGKSWISVLEVGDCNCAYLEFIVWGKRGRPYRASG
jgi:hypothetical protein